PEHFYRVHCLHGNFRGQTRSGKAVSARAPMFALIAPGNRGGQGDPMTYSLTRISLASTLAVVLATPAWAQDTASDAGNTGGDIIVTARRTEEKLQDVPISMTVLNS